MSNRTSSFSCATLYYALGCTILLSAGCNASRYGTTYDRRLPELKRIGVVPVGVEVFSLHSGGIAEPRPDEVEPAAARLAGAVSGIVRDRGADPRAIPQPSSRAASGETNAPQLALLAAVRDAILTHHYEYGKERQFSYQVGDAARTLASEDVDAVLCIYARGTVPTSGRRALQTTAAVVGALTGIRIGVSTYELTLIVMLVDRSNGDVLWFDHYQTNSSIRSDNDVRGACRKACAYLLKPRD